MESLLKMSADERNEILKPYKILEESQSWFERQGINITIEMVEIYENQIGAINKVLDVIYENNEKLRNTHYIDRIEKYLLKSKAHNERYVSDSLKEIDKILSK